MGSSESVLKGQNLMSSSESVLKGQNFMNSFESELKGRTLMSSFGSVLKGQNLMSSLELVLKGQNQSNYNIHACIYIYIKIPELAIPLHSSSQLSAQTLLMCLYSPCVQSYTSTSVCKLKIPNSAAIPLCEHMKLFQYTGRNG